MPALTASGNEITDLLRASALQGDGRAAPDSSFGFWPASTNLIKNGGAEVNATGNVLAGGATITRDTTVRKFGAACFKVVTSATSGSSIQWIDTAALHSRIQVQPSTTYTVSVYVQGALGTEALRLEVDSRDSTGAHITFDDFDFTPTTGMVRYTLTFTTGATATEVGVLLKTRAAGVMTFWADGAQLELGPVATPYIETSGATASRGAPRVQAPASLLGVVQGWMAVRMRAGVSRAGVASLSSAQARIFRWIDGTDGLAAFLTSTGVTLVRNATSGVSLAAAIAAWNPGDALTLVFAWTATQLFVSVNGGAFTSIGNTSTSFGAMGSIDIGTFGTGRELCGDVFWLATGTGTLTSANAATLHGYGNAGPTFSQLQGIAAAAPTAVWAADTTYYDPAGIPSTGSMSLSASVPSPSVKTDVSARGSFTANTHAPSAVVEALLGAPADSTFDAHLPATSVQWPPGVTPLPAHLGFRAHAPDEVAARPAIRDQVINTMRLVVMMGSQLGIVDQQYVDLGRGVDVVVTREQLKGFVDPRDWPASIDDHEAWTLSSYSTLTPA